MCDEMFENEYFHLQPCYTCPLPGYLILSAKVTSDAIQDMPEAALSALGPTLAVISRSIQAVLMPERIYTTLFCEAQRGVHFHIFPRTAWLREAYLAHYSAERLTDGPRLLSWARRTFTQVNSRIRPGAHKQSHTGTANKALHLIAAVRTFRMNTYHLLDALSPLCHGRCEAASARELADFSVDAPPTGRAGWAWTFDSPQGTGRDIGKLGRRLNDERERSENGREW